MGDVVEIVNLIFIAGERTAEGSEAYHQYVKEWLADETTICLINAEFTRLQELFRFNGIPHYETITPDCRRVRDDLQVNGFYNFNYEMQNLKEKLENLSHIHPVRNQNHFGFATNAIPKWLFT